MLGGEGVWRAKAAICREWDTLVSASRLVCSWGTQLSHQREGAVLFRA